MSSADEYLAGVVGPVPRTSSNINSLNFSTLAATKKIYDDARGLGDLTAQYNASVAALNKRLRVGQAKLNYDLEKERIRSVFRGSGITASSLGLGRRRRYTKKRAAPRKKKRVTFKKGSKTIRRSYYKRKGKK